MDLVGPDGKIEVGNGFQQFSSAALRHTSHDTELQLRMFFFQPFQNAEFADGFPLGLIAHTACVENDQVGIVFGMHNDMTVCGKHCGGGIAVAFIHLTAIGLDIDVHGLFFRVFEDCHIVAVNEFMIGVAAEYIMDFRALTADQTGAILGTEIDESFADGFSFQ